MIVAPAIAYLFNKEKFLNSYFVGIGGLLVGVVANYSILMFSYQIRDQQFSKENPYYYSNYSSPDSTEYVKYDTDSDAKDFSNINEEKIRKVSLNDLGLRVLPDEIAKIDSLEELNLSVNPEMNFSKSLSKIENPSALKRLSLVNSNLHSLPKELLLFSNLERLYIGGNPNLDPKESFELLQKLNNLEELWIQGNQWESLPNSFANLKSLNLLYAKRNQFSELPETINKMDSLEKIFIYGNPVAQNYTQFIDTSKVKVFADR